MSVALASSWRNAWRDLGAQRADEQLMRQLVAKWSEPHRHYHTLRHLRECLEQLEAVRQLAEQPAQIELALWFHDGVYEPRRDDNELRSAEWARESVLHAGLDKALADRIHSLVMSTTHSSVPKDADAQLLADVDLAILGAPADRFNEYERQIRAEYAHAPDEMFREGRRLLLQKLLARPKLYFTQHFLDRLESQARFNLQASLAQLSQR